MLIYPETSNIEVEELLNELIKSDFYFSIIRDLDINDLDFEIKMDQIKTIGGYPDTKSKAISIPNEDKSKVKMIVFFTESMSGDINRRFSRIYDTKMFNEIIKVYVKFILIHELVHVQQIKNGLIMDEYLSIDYKDREAEKSANEKAVEILSREGKFQAEITQMITDNKGIEDNIVAQEYRRRFLPYFK